MKFSEGPSCGKILVEKLDSHKSDMSIEESVMRQAKTSGGIGHGALRHEDALGSWFLFYRAHSKVSEDYAGSIRRQADTTSYKHPNTAIVTKIRNSLAVETIIDFLEKNNRFDSNIDKCDLISLVTGLTDRTGECNSKTAKKFGEEFYQIRSN